MVDELCAQMFIFFYLLDLYEIIINTKTFISHELLIHYFTEFICFKLLNAVFSLILCTWRNLCCKQITDINF